MKTIEILDGELTFFPERICNEEGIYCDDCGTVFYGSEIVKIMRRNDVCPICGGCLLWVTPACQPE